MNQNPQPTNERILYAQALQIAIQLAGDTAAQNPLSTEFPNDLLVEQNIRKYHKLP